MEGREAHRGRVCDSEHSWAVQAAPVAPAAVGDDCSSICVCVLKTNCVHVKVALCVSEIASYKTRLEANVGFLVVVAPGWRATHCGDTRGESRS